MHCQCRLKIAQKRRLVSTDQRSSSLNFSAGEWKSSVARGRLFSSRATSFSRRCGMRERSVVLGKYCPRSPFVFSLVPRCQGLCGSHQHEPPLVWRRPGYVCAGTRAVPAGAAANCSSYTAGGRYPMVESSRTWLNHATQTSVWYSTGSRPRHGPCRAMTSVLYSPITLSASALS